eukprot:2501901-Rhodomonas_salina.1
MRSPLSGFSRGRVYSITKLQHVIKPAGEDCQTLDLAEFNRVSVDTGILPDSPSAFEPNEMVTQTCLEFNQVSVDNVSLPDSPNASEPIEMLCCFSANFSGVHFDMKNAASGTPVSQSAEEKSCKNSNSQFEAVPNPQEPGVQDDGVSLDPTCDSTKASPNAPEYTIDSFAAAVANVKVQSTYDCDHREDQTGTLDVGNRKYRSRKNPILAKLRTLKSRGWVLNYLLQSDRLCKVEFSATFRARAVDALNECVKAKRNEKVKSGVPLENLRRFF